MERADLEAPGQSSAIRVCERCFAAVSPGADFCQECGVPVSAVYTEGSDSAIYPLLARANLLRMRGDYKPAEDVCLGILRRFPNNATANGLLGDISAERGDLEQAKEWYELALDLTPDAPGLEQKLNSVQHRIKERDTAATAQNLGLPAKSPPVALYAGIAIAVILVTGIAAFFIGRQAWAGRGEPTIIEAPVTLDDPKQSSVSTPQQEPPGQEQTAQAPPAGRTDGETQLLQNLAKSIPEGNRVVSASLDPRTKALTLTFSMSRGEDHRATAARLAAAACELVPDCNMVTVRGVLEGKLAFVGDVHRQSIGPASTPDWRSASANDPNTFADAVLTNIWEEMPQPGPGSATNTTGSTIGGDGQPK